MIRQVNRRRKASGFEKEIHAILREEKIPFIPEKTVGRCHADLFIAPNTLVELNGCYWHGHDCQGKLTKSQKTAQAKDGRRYYFFRKLGFSLEIIWECDFEKDPESVRARLKTIYENN
jgi:G:T-mismatch repair DNA endonuclease (very short patch repair protein)